MKKVNARIEDEAANLFIQNFKSLSGGVEYFVSCFPDIYDNTIEEVKGVFTEKELYLLIESLNGLILQPQIAGKQLTSNIYILEDNIFAKYNIDKGKILEKLKGLRFVQAVVLEIFCAGFFQQKEKSSIEEYIKDGL